MDTRAGCRSTFGVLLHVFSGCDDTIENTASTFAAEAIAI